MPIFDTSVTSVTQRVVNTKDGRSTTVFDITDGSGTKWSTFKQPVANEANRLIGMAVELQGRIEKSRDGRFDNHIIDDIRAGTGAAQRAHQGNGNNPIEQAQQAQQQNQSIPTSEQSGEVMVSKAEPTDKDWSIMRQTAGKVSAHLSSNPKEFWQNLDALLTYFAYGLMPPEETQARNQVRQDPHAAEERQFIPEGSGQTVFHPAGHVDPGADPSKPDMWDDIPFNHGTA